jgi:hypothetical protein
MGGLGSMFYKLRLLAHRPRFGLCGIAFLLIAVLAFAPNASAAPSGCTASKHHRCNFTAASTTLTYTAKDAAGLIWSITDTTTGTILAMGSSSASGTVTVTQGDSIQVAIGSGNIKATT